jgi:ABC-type branched-subunit amino acid transport system substrate-binding protein
VIQLAEDFERDFPTSSKLPEVLNLKGLAWLLTQDSERAAQAFTLALSRAPEALLGDRNWKNYVRYNQAAAFFEGGKWGEAERALQAVDLDAIDSPNRLKTLLLKARVFEKKGNIQQALSTWSVIDQRRDELQLAPESILNSIERLLQGVSDSEPLVLSEKSIEKTLFADRVAFRCIQLLMKNGQSADAQSRLREFLKTFPTSAKATEAAGLLRGMRSETADARPAIGLLIPQKGKFARVGQRVLQSVSLALGVFGTGTPPGPPLIIEDSGEDIDSALQALERLHSKHRVAIVIGPVMSKGADAVIQRAEELGLPIVSLAQQASYLGEYSTQGAITPAVQTRELARLAIQKHGMKRFAILAPKDRFGEEHSQSFWSAVEEFGGSVTAFETYSPGETDFRKAVDQLSGLFYADARLRETTALAKERIKNQIKKRTRKTERYFSLPPVVDFDAVFIPDEPKAASLAIPTFAYRDIDHIKILGISAWNSDEFIQRSQEAGNGVMFLDAYYSSAPQPSPRLFSDRFTEAFGQKPATLEAIAYDVGQQVSRLLSSAAHDETIDRQKVAESIRQIRDATGATGKISVRDGVWTRDLRVLTIHQSEVMEWAKSPYAQPASSAD